METAKPAQTVKLQATAAEFLAYVKSGHSLYWLKTTDETAAKDCLAPVIDLICEGEEKNGGFAVVSSAEAAHQTADFEKILERAVKQRAFSVIMVADAHLLFKSDAFMARRIKDMQGFLKTKNIYLVFVSPTSQAPLELEREIHYLELPLPSFNEIYSYFEAYGFWRKSELSYKAATVCRGLTMREIKKAAARAKIAYASTQDENDAMNSLVQEKKSALKRSRGLDVVDQIPTMDEVGGMAEVKNWLSARRYAFSPKAQKFGLPLPKGLLLLGVQGCGKSMFSKASASIFNFPLVRLDVGSLFVSDLPADELLRRALDTCDNLSPAVLWLDEIEKGFAGSQGQDFGATRLLGYFLSWLQERTSQVFVVATANNIDLLPPEFVRKGRFDEIFFVDLPTENERREIFKVHLKKRKRNPDNMNLDKAVEITRNFSGAEIEQVIVSALFRAYSASRDVTAEDVFREAELMIPLYKTQEESIKKLREWAANRARPASSDSSLLKYFKG